MYARNVKPYFSFRDKIDDNQQTLSDLPSNQIVFLLRLIFFKRFSFLETLKRQ